MIIIIPQRADHDVVPSTLLRDNCTTDERASGPRPGRRRNSESMGSGDREFSSIFSAAAKRRSPCFLPFCPFYGPLSLPFEFLFSRPGGQADAWNRKSAMVKVVESNRHFWPAISSGFTGRCEPLPRPHSSRIFANSVPPLSSDATHRASDASSFFVSVPGSGMVTHDAMEMDDCAFVLFAKRTVQAMQCQNLFAKDLFSSWGLDLRWVNFQLNFKF